MSRRDDLYLITQPRFVPYDRCARLLPEAGLRREYLADPEKWKEIAEALGVDAVLFCNIAFASFAEAPEDYEPGGVNIEKVPTGQKGGGEHTIEFWGETGFGLFTDKQTSFWTLTTSRIYPTHEHRDFWLYTMIKERYSVEIRDAAEMLVYIDVKEGLV